MAIETELPDNHKMTISVLKRYVKKKAPLIINYRNYKNYNEEHFRYDLIRQLSNNDNINYDDFKGIFMEVLDKHAPPKRKVIRGSNE